MPTKAYLDVFTASSDGTPPRQNLICDESIFHTTGSELQPGINLIEAAAGTGKTYAIAMLVLRFVVEHEVDVKRLLVVTFTKAATEELKERIRQRLAETKQALTTDTDLDPNLQQWLDRLPLSPDCIRQRLHKALLDIDQAAIFTIHGFCQRVLTEHALESGQMFDCELSGDIAAIKQNCADDFWRKQLYQRPTWQAALLMTAFNSPAELLTSIYSIDLQQTIYPADSDLEQALDNLNKLLANAAASLPATMQTLTQAFQQGMFNDSYTKAVPEKYTALKTWLNQPETRMADVSWLTSAGLQAGLNGRKFLVSKSKPQPSDQQKQDYLGSLKLDCQPFDALATALQQLQVVLRRALLDYLSETLDKALQQNNVLSFDDLITRLYQALSAPQASHLVNELQQRFDAALIDEFQDTDHKQWQIFSQIFATERHYLYLIGDPKQAIYKFRGADIYSYFKAQQQADRRYTLQHNWRSHPDLVAGVNQLFKRTAPFLLPELSYYPVNAGRSVADGRIGETPPIILWQLTKNPGKQEHWTAGKAAAAIREAVIAEILQLLTGNSQINSQQTRVLQPRDIAILVRSNAQAADYQLALNVVGIPAVLNSKQSVFAAPQALELHTVLQAIAQPGHLPALKQALTINWFNLNGQQLYQLFDDESRLDAWLNRFQDYLLLWQTQGLLCMMQRLLEQEQVEQHLCLQTQAERVLTNLHHIIERLQQAAIDEHLAINKTLDWLRRAILQAPQDNSEDRQLRLESDEDTVQIVTLHSSKGLEYPVVFCPNLWQRNDRLKSEQQLLQCHENGEMIADLGSEHFNDRRAQALYEELAEDLRLFYVAITRAKYRCYLAWADVRSKDKANDSAMAYLLEFADADFAGQQQKLASLVQALPQAFQWQVIPAETQITAHYQAAANNNVLSVRQKHRSLQTHWQMSSYTALSALSLHDAPELPQDKAVEPADVVADEHQPETGDSQTPLADELPRGPQTGNAIHSLLETISFKQLAAGANISQARDQAIRRHGLNLDNPALIDGLLQTIVTTPLAADPGFQLQHLPDKHCLKEMPFYLSMQSMDVANINRILQHSPACQPLSSKQMCGYLTGFIDLICEYQGKYYVMDYKTNSLPNYQPETLLQAMRQHNYGLQYWLYSLVLDRYLQQRLPDYQYSRHFGGAKYLFVRGMRVDLPGHAVFADLPEEKVIRVLEGVFFGE